MKRSSERSTPRDLGLPHVGIQLGRLLLRTPLGRLVQWVAGIRASLHTKFLIAFLAVALLFVATAAGGLQTVRGVAQRSNALDLLHERVDLSRQLEQTLAMQMNFTAMALNLRNEEAIKKILHENNRFNNKLAEIERDAPSVERDLIEQIRLAQDELLVAVADIANLVRDQKTEQAMQLHIETGQPLYDEIEALVQQIVKIETEQMKSLRQGLGAAHHRAMILIGVFAGAAVLLALALGFVISWSVILPMQEANAFLNNVAKGEFDATIRISNRDEFGALASEMNHMSQDLRRLYQEQEDAAQRLRSLNKQLELASKAKSEFLANMSHELRTPLNAVIGFSEVLKQRMFGELNEKQAEYIQDIYASGHHLLSLINDILDLSKIEAGHMELELSRFDVEDAIGAALTLVKERATRRRLALDSDIAPAIGLIVGEERKFKQILLNLLTNAIKFTPEGGAVHLRASRKEDRIEVSVRDTGVGIAKDDQARIFDEFQQLRGGYGRDVEGTGLGLSLTQRFVEMHGGRIEVESEVGKGSVFMFWLPLSPLPDTATREQAELPPDS